MYVQIRDQVIKGPNGMLQNGESLPSTRQLAIDFGINFHTVNKAYDMLWQKGILRLNRLVSVEKNVKCMLAAGLVSVFQKRFLSLTIEQIAAGVPQE